MSTRIEFDDEDVPLVLRRLLMQGRLRDYVLIELYANVPLSIEKVVQMRVQDVHAMHNEPNILFVHHRDGLRRVHLGDEGGYALKAWIKLGGLTPQDYLFPSTRIAGSHFCARQARRLVDAVFRRAADPLDRPTATWASTLQHDFNCKLSRWPWVPCVRAHAGGEQCLSRCEGLKRIKQQRPFRTHGIVPTRGEQKLS